MLVTRQNFNQVVLELSEKGIFSVDTETTGLRPYQEDKLFSIIIAKAAHEGPKAWYFNFNELNSETCLPREFLSQMQSIFENPESYWFAHNAKFDMAFLAREGLLIQGAVHCTEGMARVEYNAHIKYSLSKCAERIGKAKDDAVENYIKQKKLWEWEKVPGKTQPQKRKFFALVPLEIMQAYGEQDAVVTLELGLWELDQIYKKSQAAPINKPQVRQVYENEKTLTKTCFSMEQAGVRIDKEYCQKALKSEERKIEDAKTRFREITGAELIDSNKELAQIFTKIGEAYPTTEKGNPSFTEEVLKGYTTPAARALLDFRKSSKRANTYFKNFLHFADRNGVVHANIRQAGTETGRFSYGDPNLQNVPKKGEDKAEFPVRRCFIPREGFFFAMLDYDQMEYRMMMDYSGQKDLIDKINSGLDVHTACMQLMEMSDREAAKTMNFMKLYGGGVQKLSDSLGIDMDKARALSNKYWEALPSVKEFIQSVTRTAETRGYIFNWFGRLCYFPDPRWAYAAPNHLIQGGCADVMKIAMNRIDAYLREIKAKSKMILQVHDELIFEVHESEGFVIPNIKEILESVYPGKHLRLTCGVEHSFKSWADKVDGAPH